MQRLRLHCRLATGFALVAMTLALLAPGVSRALAHARGDATPWGLICSAPGSGPRSDPATSAVHALDACAFCVVAGDVPPLPAATPQLPRLPALSQALPQLFLHAPCTLFAWLAAQPRGPPLTA